GAFDRQAAERRALRENADRSTHAAREALDASRRTRFEAELTLERRRADQDHLVESCQTEFHCLPAELEPLGASADAPDEAVLAEDVLAEEVTIKTLALEKLGPVNHAALEEFDTESTRLRELSTQKLDLENSLDQILETIKTINVTSSERFQEA